MKKFFLTLSFIFNTIFGFTENLLRMELNGNGFVDETIVYFGSENNDTFLPTEDAVKLFSSLPGVPSLYTIIDSNNISINAMGVLDQDKTISLAIKSQTATNYEIKATDFTSFDITSGLYLEDLEENITINLRNTPNYQFSLPVGDIQNRFLLHFRPAVRFITTQAGCDDNDGKVTIVYNSNEIVDLIVKDQDDNLITYLYSFNGTIDIDSLTSGNYIVYVGFNNYSTVDYFTIPNSKKVTVFLNTSTTNTTTNDPIIFFANIVNGINHNWSFGDGTNINSTNLLNTVHVYENPGTYLITLNSSNGECVGSDSIIVNIDNFSGFFNKSKNQLTEILLGRSSVTIKFLNVPELRGDIKLFDIAGRCVKYYRDVSFSGSQTFDLTDVSSGNYIICIGTSITRMIHTLNP